jgi:MFS family permease
MVFSIMMISLCKQFWQFLLCQGVLLGISMSLVSWPMLALVAKNVTAKNRAASMGIVLGGSSLGGIVWPIAIDQMMKNHSLGFPWTMRICAFIMIPLFILPCAVASAPSAPPVPAPTRPIATSDSETEVSGREDGVYHAKEASEKQATATEENVDLKEERKKLFKKPAMLLLCLALFFTYFGMFGPFFYITTYAIQKGFSSTLAFYTISIVNGASFFGRVIPGVLADKYGKFNLIILSNLLAGIIAMCWTKVTSVAGLVIWCAAYGFASGVSHSPLFLLSIRS